jgi:hypothetical protein
MTDIAYLEAYVAISQVKAQYCRGLDTKDWVAYGAKKSARALKCQ